MQNPKELLKEIFISAGTNKEPSYAKTKTKSLHPPIETHWQVKEPKSNRSLTKMFSYPFKSWKSFRRSKSTELVLEGPHNPNDEKLVESFRELLLLEGLLPPKHFDYHTLLRFLRMRDFDLLKAKDMFVQYIKWREEFGVDAISKEFKYEELDEVKKCYPHGFHGVDRYGRPVYIERIGMVDLERFSQVTTIERFVKHHVWEQEKTLNWRFPACSLAAKKHIASTLSILDVKDVGMSQFSKPARYLFLEIQKIDSSYYPETLHQLFIINAGSGFRVLWRAVRAFLDARTLAKIRVLGTDYKNSLIEAIDPSNLPSFLGGDCTCCESDGCLYSDKGPWNDPQITQMLHGMLCSEEEQEDGQRNASNEKNVGSVDNKPLLEKIQAFEPALNDAKTKISLLETALRDTKLALQGLAQHIEELKR